MSRETVIVVIVAIAALCTFMVGAHYYAQEVRAPGDGDSPRLLVALLAFLFVACVALLVMMTP